MTVRCSQLPFCPLNFFVTHATRGVVSVMDMRGMFYVTIGSGVHEVVQDFLGTSGRFLADWECRVCGKKYHMTTQHECCDFPMKYHEIEVDFKGIVGHIDAIFVDSLGRFWIVDFKTTSVKSAVIKQKTPGHAYVEQVETYALLMKLQYKIKVHGTMLMFIKRDGPAEPVIWSRPIDDADFERIKVRTVKYKKMHRVALNVTTKAEALALLKYGKCKNPWCRVCLSSDPKRLVLKAYKDGVAASHLPIKDLKVNKYS